MTTPPKATVLLDVNVLMALTWDQHVHHRIAHKRFSQLETWATCATTEAGLLRLLLTEAVVGRKVTGAEALGQLRAIHQVPGWRQLDDSASLAASLIDSRVLMGRNQMTDLHLVNLAATHNTRLATFDAGIRDFLLPTDQRWVEVWRA